MMRVDSATSPDTCALSHPRSAACTSCACSLVATLPVPMAHTGSYATTMRAHSAGVTTAASAAICRNTTSVVCPASRSASVSPMQNTTLRPVSSATCARRVWGNGD
jgi:hypothetical protein